VRNVIILVVVLVMSVIVAACDSDDSTNDLGDESSELDQPYAGLVDREIRALSDTRINDLLAGNGAGYALAAELNSYPGPTHVLDLAEQLGLSSDQHQAVDAIFGDMQREARELGQALVDLEAELEQRFRDGDIDEEEISELTGEIAAVEGELRATHLAAHLELKSILTIEQIALYDELRGYGAPGDSDRHDHSDHDSHDHHS
jgi:Spy/CpxP family protein refolding chaperone